MDNLLVIGGGAAGMMAALTARQMGVGVTLLEAQPRLGRKLLATGNGRCNFSHMGFSAANYHGRHPRFVMDALAHFNEADTVAFFEALGVATTTDERRRYYPESLQAQAVLDCFRLALEESGVEVCTDTRVTKLRQDKNGLWHLDTTQGKRTARAVIVATGGETQPKLGGCRDGYKLLIDLGHAMIKTQPAIVQLEGDIAPLKACVGLKRDMLVRIEANGKRVAQDVGEVLITKYGISGPPVLQCAGAAVRGLEKGQKVRAVLSFFPDEDAVSLEERLTRRHQDHPKRKAEAFFVGLLPRMMAASILKAAGLRPADNLNAASIRTLSKLLTQFPLTITASRGFNEAQVTQGGIDTADFSSATMGSWLSSGLYAAGEVLDIDGDCGGYNLQWAWSSGHLAASEAADYIKQETKR